MSITDATKKRRIIPRWRSSGAAVEFEEFSSLSAIKIIKKNIEDEFFSAIHDFKLFPSLGTASELLALGSNKLKNKDVLAAAKFVSALQDDAPPLLYDFSLRIINNSGGYNKSVSTQRTRELLRINDKNPALWVDLARHYSIVGKKEKALKSMHVALGLEPNHRWILRTAARLYIHQDLPDIAHKLLAKNPATKHDPWLMAAEVACAQVAGKQSLHYKNSLYLLKSTMHPQHLSELATAIAMLERDSGNNKKARGLIELGVKCPTENSLAQIFSLKDSSLVKEEKLIEKLTQARNAHEAKFHSKLQEGDFVSAIVSAKNWAMEEPFSSRPFTELAYVNAVLDDYAAAKDNIMQVYKIDGELSLSLELNLIFCDICMKDHDPKFFDSLIRRLTEIIKSGAIDAYHACANAGLVLFRAGEIEIAHKYYKESIEMAKKINQYDAAAMAAIFYAREAKLSKYIGSEELLILAQNLTGKSKSKVVKFYLKKIEAFYARPESYNAIFNPNTSWVFQGDSAGQKLFNFENIS